MSNSGANSPKSVNSNTMYNSNSTSASARMDYDEVIYPLIQEINNLRKKMFTNDITEKEKEEIEAKIEELEDTIEKRKAELYQETRVKKAAAAKKGGKRRTKRKGKKTKSTRRK